MKFIRISDLTRQRWGNFKGIKRAYYSLWILGVGYILSLGAPFWVNDKPLFIHYEDKMYFPVFQYYPSTEFGGQYKTEADYVTLRENEGFMDKAFVIQPLIPHSPLRPYLEAEGMPPHPPSSRHWLGTDGSARDILSRLIYGFRICMTFSLILTLLSAVVGIIIGGVQGYLGGKTDLFVQRGIEIWASLPFLYVVILLGSIYGRSFFLLLFILALFQWIGLSYYMRGEFYRLRNQTYVRVSRALGFGPLRIFFRQILPNAITPVITLLPFLLISGIGSLTSLDFLGFGLPPPTPSWGELLDQGLKHLYAPWVAFSAVGALFFTLLLATFIGEGVREAFDPRSGGGAK